AVWVVLAAAVTVGVVVAVVWASGEIFSVLGGPGPGAEADPVPRPSHTLGGLIGFPVGVLLAVGCVCAAVGDRLRPVLLFVPALLAAAGRWVARLVAGRERARRAGAA